jgi:hypothetical protein
MMCLCYFIIFAKLGDCPGGMRESVVRMNDQSSMGLTELGSVSIQKWCKCFTNIVAAIECHPFRKSFH